MSHFTDSQKQKVRFSTTEEEITTSSEFVSIKRVPSWSGLTSISQDTQLAAASSGSETSLSVNTSSSHKLSPKLGGRSPKLSRGESIDSDVSDSGSQLNQSSMTLETFLLNETKFVHKETAEVRGKLNKKVGASLSNCWRDMLWHELLV